MQSDSFAKLFSLFFRGKYKIVRRRPAYWEITKSETAVESNKPGYLRYFVLLSQNQNFLFSLNIDGYDIITLTKYVDLKLLSGRVPWLTVEDTYDGYYMVSLEDLFWHRSIRIIVAPDTGVSRVTFKRISWEFWEVIEQ